MQCIMYLQHYVLYKLYDVMYRNHYELCKIYDAISAKVRVV